MLTRDHERPILLKRTRIHQLGDIFTRHPAATRMALSHRFLPILIERKSVAIKVFLQIVTNVIEVNGLRFGHLTTAHRSLLDKNDGIRLPDHVTGSHSHLTHNTVVLCSNYVFHLHGFNHR